MFHSMKNDYTEFACAVSSQKIMTLWICSVRLANHLPVLCIGFPRYVSPRYSPAKSWLKSPSRDVTHKPRKRLKNGTVISVRAWWNIRICCRFITDGWGCLDCHFETYCFCCQTWEPNGKYTWHMNSQKWWYGLVPRHTDNLFAEVTSSFLWVTWGTLKDDFNHIACFRWFIPWADNRSHVYYSIVQRKWSNISWWITNLTPQQSPREYTFMASLQLNPSKTYIINGLLPMSR